MTWDIAFILSVDGLATGAIYLLAGIGLVLVFAVTRVVFLPFGDIAVFSALTLAALEAGRFPRTVLLVVVFVVLAMVVELGALARRREFSAMPRALFVWSILPLLPCVLVWWLSAANIDSPAARAISAVLLAVPVAPLLARVALQPVASSSVLVLLIVSLALHFLLTGLCLYFFGPEGFRVAPLLEGSVALAQGITVNYQVLLMVGSAVAISFALYLFFEFTLSGKALRATAVNRVGARLIGVRPHRTAMLAFTVASGLAGAVGVLIAPIFTLYYDSGFMIGLKAFIAAIMGGLVSFPVTAIGGIGVGLVESFASFFSSSFKDAMVFGLLIPVLIVRSWMSSHSEEDGEELDA